MTAAASGERTGWAAWTAARRGAGAHRATRGTPRARLRRARARRPGADSAGGADASAGAARHRRRRPRPRPRAARPARLAEPRPHVPRPGSASMKRADIAPFFATLRDANPEPATELDYASVFELLAAVLLSAQATDRGVNKATRALFAAAPTPAKMLALGLPALEDAIRTIGLFRTKAKNLHATCRILVEQHGGQVPRTREAARSAARRRPQDRQRRPQQRVRRPDAGGRHARLSRRQPDRAGRRQRRRSPSRSACCSGCRPNTSPMRTTG